MKLTLSIALLILAGCQVYQTRGPAEPNKTRDLTPLCHGGKQTLRIEDDAEVRAHLAHGDTLGQCRIPDAEPAGSTG